MSIKQSLYESARLANQISLLDIEQQYEQQEVITSVEMLEKWIVNFVNNQGVSYESVTLNFLQMETDPPVYLVMVEGYQDSYVLLGEQAYVKYVSGAMIVSEEVEEEREKFFE